MENTISLSDFFSANNLSPDPYGNYKFRGKVEYLSSVKHVVELTEIKIIMGGYNGGKISIHEHGELNVLDFHLDFEERFQTYKYDENTKELTIYGNSLKMCGKYEVRISL